MVVRKFHALLWAYLDHDMRGDVAAVSRVKVAWQTGGVAVRADIDVLAYRAQTGDGLERGYHTHGQVGTSGRRRPLESRLLETRYIRSYLTLALLLALSIPL